MIYSLNGTYPRPLPFRIRLSGGSTRTDPDTFTDEEIADAGYVLVSETPSITDSQVISWDSDLVDWVVRDKNEVELAAEREALKEQINTERDFRIESGFVFGNNKFDSALNDQKRISGAALLAVISGGQAGDLRWHGGDTDFVWITADNAQVPMDAPTMIAFASTAAEWERAHIFAARTLKDTTPIPDNYYDDVYWP